MTCAHQRNVATTEPSVERFGLLAFDGAEAGAIRASDGVPGCGSSGAHKRHRHDLAYRSTPAKTSATTNRRAMTTSGLLRVFGGSAQACVANSPGSSSAW